MSGVVALVVDFGSHAAWFSLISWAGRGLTVGLLRSRTMAHVVIKKDGAKSHCWLITMHCRKHVKMQLARRPLQTVHSAKSPSSQYSTPQGVTAALNMAADRCRHVYLTMENAHGHATTGYQHSWYYCPLAAVRCRVHISISRTYPQSVARPCWRYGEHATSDGSASVMFRVATRCSCRPGCSTRSSAHALTWGQLCHYREHGVRHVDCRLDVD